MFSRAKRHHQLWEAGSEKSFMMRHYIQHHEDVPKDQVEYSFEVLQYHRSAFERQVQEACAIKWSREDPGVLNLNRKLEYNRSIIPEIGTQQDPTKEETEEDDRVTKKILEWKIKRGKEKAAEKERIRREKLERRAEERREMNQSNLDAWLAGGEATRVARETKRQYQLVEGDLELGNLFQEASEQMPPPPPPQTPREHTPRRKGTMRGLTLEQIRRRRKRWQKY